MISNSKILSKLPNYKDAKQSTVSAQSVAVCDSFIQAVIDEVGISFEKAVFSLVLFDTVSQNSNLEA